MKRFACLVFVLAACGDDSSAPASDAGADASVDAERIDVGPRPDTGPLPDAGPFVGDHDYFEFLVAQPEHLHDRAYRTIEEIEDDLPPPTSRVDYDPSQDAARWTFGPDVGSMSSADQLRSSFGPITDANRNAFLFWEARWDSAWATNRGGIENHKAFQIGGIEGGGDPRGLEPRTRFGLADPGAVALIDCRIYGWNPTTPGPADTFAPLDAEFHVAGNTWTRFWFFADFENLEASMWVGDETRAPQAVYARSQFEDMSPENLESFWFEFNSSQSRSDPETIFTWGRNLVVLQGVANYEAAESLVMQGDQTR